MVFRRAGIALTMAMLLAVPVAASAVTPDATPAPTASPSASPNPGPSTSPEPTSTPTPDPTPTDVALASPEDTGFRVLSRGNSGASADGTATTTVNVQASPAEFDFVCAYVVLRDRDRNVVDDDRWAWTVLDIRQAASDPG
jgi:hypothetical protein